MSSRYATSGTPHTRKHPSHGRDANRLSKKELKKEGTEKIIHREWDFFKHADHDPDAMLEFDFFR
jgi:hypothetical protein